MSKSVFISYSRKDAIDVAEFRSIDTFRDFEILIDDEEIEFNKPWKQNIRNKINDSNGAILFLTKNALNPESPIRTLELPLIAKRYADKEDNFNFFPIFLEDIDEELLNNYSFTPLETKEEVSFVEFFQLYGEQQRTTVRELTNRKRKHFYKTANANISHILEGGTLSPGETMLSKLSRRQRIRNMSIGFAVVISIFLFARTDTFARVLINAAERVQPENIDEGNSVLFNAIAGQLNNIDNLEELGADQALVENIEEVNQVNSESNEQGLSSSISVDTSTTTISTSTTTTTTVAPATTTSSTPTTTTTTIKTYSLKFSDNVVEFPEIPYCKMTYEEVEDQLKAHFLANDIRLTIRKFLVETENTDCYGLASGSNKPYLVEIKDGDFIEVTVEWSSSKREFPTTIANSPNAIGNNERWDVYCDNSGKSYLDDTWRGEKTGSGSDQYFYFGLYTDLTSPDISCVPDAMLESLGYFLNSGYYCKNEGCVTSPNTSLAPTTTTTTVAPTTTTTTVAPTTTTTTVAWSPPADSNEPIINGTYENICMSQGWTECARWTVYDEFGNDTGGGGIGPYPLSAFQNLVSCVSGGVNVCGGSPTGYAVVTGRYYPDESVDESFSYSFGLRCDGGPDGYNVGPKVTTVGGSAVVEWYNYNANGDYSSPSSSFYVDADSTSSRALYWGNGIDSNGNWNILTIYYRVGQTLSEAQSQNYSSSVTVDLSQGCP